MIEVIDGDDYIIEFGMMIVKTKKSSNDGNLKNQGRRGDEFVDASQLDKS